ncbi:hypothetical protein UlMin_010300 [Ulmus minor]
MRCRSLNCLALLIIYITERERKSPEVCSIYVDIYILPLLHKGIIARTAHVFGLGGHAYVYHYYGLHTMLNVVADKEGNGAAVLIRVYALISGIFRKSIGSALGLSTEWSNHPLYTLGGLEILEGPAPEKLLIDPRVGIDYASPKHVHALWRSIVAGTPWISS